MQRSLLYEHIRSVSSQSEFFYFIKLLSKCIKEDKLSFSKKNQDLVIETKRNFDYEYWNSIFSKWSSLTNLLETLQADKDYQVKQEQFEGKLILN